MTQQKTPGPDGFGELPMKIQRLYDERKVTFVKIAPTYIIIRVADSDISHKYVWTAENGWRRV